MCRCTVRRKEAMQSGEICRECALLAESLRRMNRTGGEDWRIASNSRLIASLVAMSPGASLTTAAGCEKRVIPDASVRVFLDMGICVRLYARSRRSVASVKGIRT